MIGEGAVRALRGEQRVEHRLRARQLAARVQQNLGEHEGGADVGAPGGAREQAARRNLQTADGGEEGVRPAGWRRRAAVHEHRAEPVAVVGDRGERVGVGLHPAPAGVDVAQRLQHGERAGRAGAQHIERDHRVHGRVLPARLRKRWIPVGAALRALEPVQRGRPAGAQLGVGRQVVEHPAQHHHIVQVEQVGQRLVLPAEAAVGFGVAQQRGAQIARARHHRVEIEVRPHTAISRGRRRRACRRR